ncbi:site-specific recombinase, phage integrase family protein, partial [mine drainage metagenome]
MTAGRSHSEHCTLRSDADGYLNRGPGFQWDHTVIRPDPADRARMALSSPPRSRLTIRRSEGPPVVGDAPFDPVAIVERFARQLRTQERSPCTVKQYTHIARTFLAFVAKPLEEVSLPDLERYREHLVLQRHYSKNSVYTTVRGLTCLFRSFGLAIAEGLEVPRRPERLPRYLSPEETHRLIEVVADSARNSAIVHVLAYGGLRVSELCDLEVQDID